MQQLGEGCFGICGLTAHFNTQTLAPLGASLLTLDLPILPKARGWICETLLGSSRQRDIPGCHNTMARKPTFPHRVQASCAPSDPTGWFIRDRNSFATKSNYKMPLSPFNISPQKESSCQNGPEGDVETTRGGKQRLPFFPSRRERFLEPSDRRDFFWGRDTPILSQGQRDWRKGDRSQR